MNNMPRTPMRKKSKKRAAREASPEGREDAAYIKDIHCLPCVICDNFGMVQTSPTDAHHTKSGRHSSERTPDRQAIPLCGCHHQGLRFDRDKSKVAFHQVQEQWEALYGPDTDYIAATQDAIERIMQ